MAKVGETGSAVPSLGSFLLYASKTGVVKLPTLPNTFYITWVNLRQLVRKSLLKVLHH